jgi:hypothetical protein
MCDCSWCAAEQGLETTDSPGICDHHLAQLLQEAEERKREREERERQKAA